MIIKWSAILDSSCNSMHSGILVFKNPYFSDKNTVINLHPPIIIVIIIFSAVLTPHKKQFIGVYSLSAFIIDVKLILNYIISLILTIPTLN